MNEQLLNIQFVKEVEKRPCLYNNNLPEYSRKDVTEKAWSDVGEIFNLTVSQCKEKWKNLRAVFVRHLKQTYGSPSKKMKPYYLSEAIKFIIPYVRALSNLPVKEEQIIEEDDVEFSFNEDDEPSPLILPHSPISCQSPVSPQNVDVKNGESTTTYDKAVIDYFNAKKAKLKNTPDDVDSRKMFLLSMLDDVRSMTESQMRKFKRKVLSVIDDILEESTD